MQTPKETDFAIYRGKRKTNNVRTLFEKLKNKFIELQKECDALREENMQLKARLAEIQSKGEVEDVGQIGGGKNKLSLGRLDT